MSQFEGSSLVLICNVQDNSKKKAVKKLAKIKIDLSNFANSNGSEVITIPFVKGAPSKGPCLLATIKTKPLKYNDKALVRVSTSGHSADRDSRLVKNIAGEDYFLDRTASEPSPTTLDTASVASGISSSVYILHTVNLRIATRVEKKGKKEGEEGGRR